MRSLLVLYDPDVPVIITIIIYRMQELVSPVSTSWCMFNTMRRYVKTACGVCAASVILWMTSFGTLLKPCVRDLIDQLRIHHQMFSNTMWQQWSHAVIGVFRSDINSPKKSFDETYVARYQHMSPRHSGNCSWASGVLGQWIGQCVGVLQPSQTPGGG